MNYLEFLMSSVPIMKIKTANNLTACFNLLDIEKKGVLTRNQVLDFLRPHFTANDQCMTSLNSNIQSILNK